MAKSIEYQTNLMYEDLRHHFTEPKIRITKEAATTIFIKIGAITKFKLMLQDGAWFMTSDDYVFPYTGPFLARWFLTKSDRILKEQVKSYLKSQFDVNPVFLNLA